jgi:hypothetical protein
MRRITPTGSFFITVPEDVIEEYDGRVASFWKKNREILLQVSSYARHEGPQIGAEERLMSLLKRQPLSQVSRSVALAVDCPDFAVARGVDQGGVAWVYAYAVWPGLAVMITISGNEREALNDGNWAFGAVRSLGRTIDDTWMRRS